MRDLAERWLALWQGADLATFEQLHAPDFVDRSPGGRRADRDGFRAGIVSLLAAFPDFRARLEDLIVDGDRAALRWSATGTQRGWYLGFAPSGSVIRFRGIETIRAAGGRVVERWGEWDGLDLARQLRVARLDLDHVQIAAPAGGEAAARAFYGELLGLAELPKPESLASGGGCWFAAGPRQIHIGIEKDFRPAKKAHVALRAADAAALEAVHARVAARGGVATWDTRQPGVRRFFTEDPWGNRVELLCDADSDDTSGNGQPAG